MRARPGWLLGSSLARALAQGFSRALVRGRSVLSLCAVLLVPGLIAGCSEAQSPRASDAPPTRIFSANLATDLILVDLVDPERVVGVTSFVDDEAMSTAVGHYPASVKRVPTADLEQIVSLSPDLVIVAFYNNTAFLTLLRGTGLRFHEPARIESFEDILRTYREIGELVGEPERAREVTESMLAGLARIDAALADIPSADRPRVLYWGDGWTAGGRSTIHELIERAGGRNVASELGLDDWAEIDSERALALDPDYLLLSDYDESADLPENELTAALLELRAVREGRLVRLPEKYLGTLSRDIVEGTRRFAHILHPGAFQ